MPLPDGTPWDVAGPVAPRPETDAKHVVRPEWLRLLQTRADVRRTLAVWRTLKAKYPAMTSPQFADAWLILGQQTAL